MVKLKKKCRMESSLRSKRFQSSYCAKVRAEAKKRFLRSPPPLPSLIFFCSCPSFLDEPRQETLATQVRFEAKLTISFMVQLITVSAGYLGEIKWIEWGFFSLFEGHHLDVHSPRWLQERENTIVNTLAYATDCQQSPSTASCHFSGIIHCNNEPLYGLKGTCERRFRHAFSIKSALFSTK